VADEAELVAAAGCAVVSTSSGFHLHHVGSFVIGQVLTASLSAVQYFHAAVRKLYPSQQLQPCFDTAHHHGDSADTQ
jgi:hypothetical protein